MNKEILKSVDVEIEKRELHFSKRPIYIKCLVIHKIIISNKVSFDKKSYKSLLVPKTLKNLGHYV